MIKHFLIIFLLISCAGIPGPDVKIYVSDPDRGGLYRAQEDDLILYIDSKTYRCTSKTDFDALIDYCFNPESPAEIIRTELKTVGKKNLPMAMKNLKRNINMWVENDK